jgi:hypothetical protein
MPQVLLVVRHEAPIRNRSATRRAIDHRFSRVFNASDTSSLGMFRKNDVYCVDYSKDDVDHNEGTVVFSDVRLNVIEVS